MHMQMVGNIKVFQSFKTSKLVKASELTDN